MSRTSRGGGGVLRRGAGLNRTGEPEALRGAGVRADLSHTLDWSRLRGRGFTPPRRRGVERVAILSEGLWRRRFGADPGIVGRALMLDGEPLSVVGVAAARGRPAWATRGGEIWGAAGRSIPQKGSRHAGYLTVLGAAEAGRHPRPAADGQDRHVARAARAAVSGLQQRLGERCPCRCGDFRTSDARSSLLILLVFVSFGPADRLRRRGEPPARAGGGAGAGDGIRGALGAEPRGLVRLYAHRDPGAGLAGGLWACYSPPLLRGRRGGDRPDPDVIPPRGGAPRSARPPLHPGSSSAGDGAVVRAGSRPDGVAGRPACGFPLRRGAGMAAAPRPADPPTSWCSPRWRDARSCCWPAPGCSPGASPACRRRDPGFRPD